MTREFALYFTLALQGALILPFCVLLYLTNAWPEGVPTHWNRRLVLLGIYASVPVGIWISGRIYMRSADWLEDRGWRPDTPVRKRRVLVLVIFWLSSFAVLVLLQVRMIGRLLDTV